ncbi:MAG: DUF1932 domain-containing protein [Dehalococcoidia bacterium]
MAVKTVGILSTGDMGAAIGSVLRQHGPDVITSLDGRSELSRLRASEADIRDAGSVDAVVAESDIVVSVLVPSEALRIAEEVAAGMARTNARPVFADCNAIAPQTVERIAARMATVGATFVDAGIIGSPPKPNGRNNGRIYCSGPDTTRFEELAQYGLDIRRVGPGIGQASGLKMVFAASTKGTTALWTELLVAAKAMGLMEPLMAEFSPNANEVSRQLMGSVTGMPRRARRWIGEMEEIALTFGHLGMTPKILEGAADMFRMVDETPLADQTSREPDPELQAMLESLASRLSDHSGQD